MRRCHLGSTTRCPCQVLHPWCPCSKVKDHRPWFSNQCSRRDSLVCNLTCTFVYTKCRADCDVQNLIQNLFRWTTSCNEHRASQHARPTTHNAAEHGTTAAYGNAAFKRYARAPAATAHDGARRPTATKLWWCVYFICVFVYMYIDDDSYTYCRIILGSAVLWCDLQLE